MTKGPMKDTIPIPTDALKPTPHVRGIDLHPGEEGQDDRREGCDERQPVLAL